jgi:hypothetical protein
MEVSLVGIILSKVYGVVYVSIGQRALVHASNTGAQEGATDVT